MAKKMFPVSLDKVDRDLLQRLARKEQTSMGAVIRNMIRARAPEVITHAEALAVLASPRKPPPIKASHAVASEAAAR